MKKLFVFSVILLLLAATLAAQAAKVNLLKDEKGWKVQVDGDDFPIKGVVWAYTPIGENYSYDLWSKPQDFIQHMVDTDMVLLSKMGVNAIRCFSTIPPEWVEYIYDRYGIFTIVNDLFGRYGVSVDGKWQFPTDYSDPATRATLVKQAQKTFETYKNTRGVLLYMLGNESNYGLEWTSTAIENLPGGSRMETKARYLYSLFEEAIKAGKTIDQNHPMGLINGDIQYLNLIAKEVPDVDLLGINTYRGKNSFDFFYQSIANAIGKPFVYTEMGADAYSVLKEQEAQLEQALLLKDQWKEIYQQSYGKGKSANCLGAFVFEWIDEWWKHGMDKGLSDHDTAGTWNNGGYEFDSIAGKNNMNEEWFGIVAQSRLTENGVNKRLPRMAYYMLQKIWELPFYTSSSQDIESRFASLDLPGAQLQGQTNMLLDPTTNPNPVFTIGGSVMSRSFEKLTDADWKSKGASGFTSGTQLTSKVDINLNPYEGLTTKWTFRHLTMPVNALGKPNADITDPIESASPNTTLPITDPVSGVAPATVGEVNTQLKNIYKSVFTSFELYQASIQYKNSFLQADYYYHNGHTDWANEGDFFGLLPESFDFFNMDKEGTHAPNGVELTFHDVLEGLKVYGGPEIFWDAKPRVMAKYYRTFGSFSLSALYDQELAGGDTSKVGSEVTLTPGVKNDPITDVDRWASVYGEANLLPLFKVQGGAMVARPNLVNNPNATFVKNIPNAAGGYLNSGFDIYTGAQFGWLDALAGKIKLSTSVLPYTTLSGQYLYAGVLANTRGSISHDGSQITDSGSGNRQEMIGTATVNYGDFSLNTKFLARFPIYDALPTITGLSRNPLANEFSVWENRKAYQGELILTYDPTGATYFYEWNNDDREDAWLAASGSFLYEFYKGPTDIYKYYDASGVAHPLTTPLPETSGTWSLKGKLSSSFGNGFRILADVKTGLLQSTGIDNNDRPTHLDKRLINFFDVHGRIAYSNLMLEGTYKLNDWGPADWFRTFNDTFPLQWSVGAAYGFKPFSYMDDSNRVGVLVSGRTADAYSVVQTEVSRLELQLYCGISF